jgi:hypothetical protein
MKIISKTFDKIIDDFIPYKQTETRYVIIDDNDKIIDDAQGYGYKTVDKAKKALWYKYKGGKEKINDEKSKAENFFKDNPKIKNFIINLIEINFKEGISDNDIIEISEKEFQQKINKNFIKYI